jgi:hypothetical protein
MKDSKLQAPTSREMSGLKLQTVMAPVLEIGSWNFPGAWMLDLGAFFACAACYGKSDSPLASGMNWGIFTLLGVILTVLTCITLFFVHVVRGEKVQIETGNNPPPQNPPKV